MSLTNLLPPSPMSPPEQPPDHDGPGRPRDTDIDRRIVEAASRLLERDGMDGVSIAAVAKEAGVGRPTVYRRYQDRVHLARAVLEADLSPLLYELAQQSFDGPIVERVMQMFTPVMAYYDRNIPRSRALLEVSLLSEGGVGPNLNQATLAWGWTLSHQLQLAQERGEISGGLDREVCMHVFFGSYMTLVMGGLNGLYPNLEVRVEAFRKVVVQHLQLG